MSTLFDDPAALAASVIILKASLVFGGAALLQALVARRASAATRHLIWTLASAGVLVLPLLVFAGPNWDVVVWTAPATPPAASIADRAAAESLAPLDSPPFVVRPDDRAPASAGWRWQTVLAGVYGAGLIAMLAQLALQHWRIRRFADHTAAVQDPAWTDLLADSAAHLGIRRSVRLLKSREQSMPMAFGTRRPSIVIPAVADSWTDDRRRAVILHELAHVARYDCLTQTLAASARAMYWFHPASWWVARRLRVERELACDDRVIAAGTEAREYAAHLLDIAYSFGRHRAPALAVSMARPHQLEGRMLAALDRARNRNVPAARARLASAALAAVVLCALAGVTPAVGAAAREEMRAVDPEASAGLTQESKDIAVPSRAAVESAKRVVRAAAAVMGLAQDGLPGTWELRPSGTDGMVNLRLVELHSSHSTNVPIAQLEGLTAAQLAGAGGPVQFRLRRDAGTFSFEGVLRSGVAAGTYSFTPDANFPAELAKRGFARPTPSEQYQMARADIGFAFLDELNRQGYAKPETSELVRAGQHGVQATYVREMGSLGYRLGSLSGLITLRDHGVSPSYVRELVELGYKGLSADDLRNARDHGVGAEYARAMRDAGYGSLPMAELVNARDHGVNAEFVRELGEAGYRKVPLDQVIRLRDHGVSTEFIRDMRQLGYTNLSTEDLVRARDHGVSSEFARAMSALGYTGLSVADLIQLRDHGVSAQYAQELKTLGYDRVPTADLVSLRDHGLSIERIRQANARAGTRLPIDLLKSLAAGGMR